MCHQSLPPPPPNSRPPSHPAWRVNIMVLLAAGFVAFSAVTVVGVVVIGLLRDAGR